MSKFSKVSLFSGLNQLRDITLHTDYSAICGYTETDLKTVFAPEFEAPVKPGREKPDLNRIRDWYNGYSWLGPEEEKVYNPFSILFLFATHLYKNWWFETATSAFLVNLLAMRQKPPVELAGMTVTDTQLAKFDVGDIGIEARLFQTGYLTIKKTKKSGGGIRCRLGYPNREVRQSLNEEVTRLLAASPDEMTEQGDQRRDLLEAGDLQGLKTLFEALCCRIPHQWYTSSDMTQHEGWYASVFFISFAVAGLDVMPEDSSSVGRADMTGLHDGTAWIFEFKVIETGGKDKALAQIPARGYAAKYRDKWRIREVGVGFSQKTRSLVRFETA